MKNIRMFYVFLLVFLTVCLSGCSQSRTGASTEVQNEAEGEAAVEVTEEVIAEAEEATEVEAAEVDNSEPVDQLRSITDLAGNQVELPPAQQIQRVVNISPPVTSVLLGAIPDSEMIVGVNPRFYSTTNQEVIKRLFPSWQDVETTFVSEGFVTNTEELLKLEPHIVFYYGEAQKAGIEELEIPTVDMMWQGNNDVEEVTIAWDNLIRDIFEAERSTSLETEWQSSNLKAEELLNTYEDEKKSALYLFSNTGGVIMVYGSGSYADAWFEKSGLENAAVDVRGQAEVSMEQIYQWDPDDIYVFIGSPATAIRSNQIQGQDWSLLKAYQNEAIYDIPQAAYSWGAPSSDSPLMPLWLISKSYPQLLSEDEFAQYFKAFYDRMYGIELEDELVAEILAPRTPQQ